MRTVAPRLTMPRGATVLTVLTLPHETHQVLGHGKWRSQLPSRGRASSQSIEFMRSLTHAPAGVVVGPPPRNAVDRDLKPWSGAVSARPPNVGSPAGWCPVPSKEGKTSGQDGQACFCESAI
jgi:hypothetical protein